MTDLFDSKFSAKKIEAPNNQVGVSSNFNHFLKGSFAKPNAGAKPTDKGAAGNSRINAPTLRPSVPSKYPILTGAAANQAADQIAKKAWEPPHDLRAPAEGKDPAYTSISTTLKVGSKNGKPVIATYGKLVFMGDGKTPTATQEKNVTAAISKLRESPTGRKLIDGLAERKGAPILFHLGKNGQAEVNAMEGMTFVKQTGADSSLHRVTVTRNYDRVDWDPTIGVATKKSTLPPWLVLGHELRHVEQNQNGRLNTTSKKFPVGFQPDLAYKETDLLGVGKSKGKNGIPDFEDDATDIENRIAREMHIKPARLRYDEDASIVRVKNSTSFPINKLK
jgi:Effector protein